MALETSVHRLEESIQFDPAVDKLLRAIDFTRYKEYIINVQGNKPRYAKLQTDLMGIEKTLSKHEVVTDTAQAYYSLGNKSTTPPYYRAMVPGSVGRRQRYGVVSSSRYVAFSVKESSGLNCKNSDTWISVEWLLISSLRSLRV